MFWLSARPTMHLSMNNNKKKNVYLANKCALHIKIHDRLCHGDSYMSLAWKPPYIILI